MSTDNLSLWRAVEKTDPAWTKGFSGRGGFKGTAVSAMYLIHKATAQWGPMGGAWGVKIVAEKLLRGAPLLDAKGQVIGNETIHQVQIDLFYPGGSVPAFGQTQLVTRRKDGFFTDEDAPKKSLTDALTKALSWLGFAADVHMGRFDDQKYVAAREKESEEERNGDAQKEVRKRVLAVLEPAAALGGAALAEAWKLLKTAEERASVKHDYAALRAAANKADAAKAVKSA